MICPPKIVQCGPEKHGVINNRTGTCPRCPPPLNPPLLVTWWFMVNAFTQRDKVGGNGTSAITPPLALPHTFYHTLLLFSFTSPRSLSHNSHYEFTHIFTRGAHWSAHMPIIYHMPIIPHAYHTNHFAYLTPKPSQTHYSCCNTLHWQDPNTCPTIFLICPYCTCIGY